MCKQYTIAGSTHIKRCTEKKHTERYSYKQTPIQKDIDTRKSYVQFHIHIDTETHEYTTTQIQSEMPRNTKTANHTQVETCIHTYGYKYVSLIEE